MNIKAKIPMKKSGYPAGFTTIELIICVAIIGIMTAIGVPNYLSYIPKARLNGATRMVISDLMAARMKAVKLNTKTKVFFLNCHQYKICDDANGDGTVDNGEGDAVLKNVQDEYSDVTFTRYSDNPVFLPRGTASWMFVKAQNSSSEAYVVVSITGQIKIYGPYPRMT